MNNIAWLLRRLPVFAVPGPGTYRVRPVHVDDVARICVEAGASGVNDTIDAVGPETLTFEEMVGMIRDAVGSRSRLIQVPPGVARQLARLIGVVARDVLLSRTPRALLMSPSNPLPHVVLLSSLQLTGAVANPTRTRRSGRRRTP